MSTFSCRCRGRASPLVENTRTTESLAIGHCRQGHSYLAFVMHTHHLVPTPVLHSRLWYPVVQRVHKRESEDIKETVPPALASTARARYASSMLCQSH